MIHVQGQSYGHHGGYGHGGYGHHGGYHHGGYGGHHGGYGHHGGHHEGVVEHILEDLFDGC